MAFSQRALLIYPAAGLSSAMQDAVANAYVNNLHLETFANERLMFDKATPASTDYGATTTHRQISSAMTPALAAALKTALAGMTGNWYLVDADTGALLDTNDANKKTGATVTKGLEWQPGVAYVADEVVSYGGQPYRVLAAHTAQSDWRPDISFSLFVRYVAPGEVSEWRQPISSVDVYPKNARVTHAETTWVSLIDSNAWEPGAVGSETLWKDENAPQTDAWAYPVAYKVGDLVTYQGKTYQCLQAHTSIASWNPVVTPALWKRV